jgi:hypothetical protein
MQTFLVIDLFFQHDRKYHIVLPTVLGSMHEQASGSCLTDSRLFI